MNSQWMPFISLGFTAQVLPSSFLSLSLSTSHASDVCVKELLLLLLQNHFVFLWFSFWVLTKLLKNDDDIIRQEPGEREAMFNNELESLSNEYNRLHWWFGAWFTAHNYTHRQTRAHGFMSWYLVMFCVGGILSHTHKKQEDSLSSRRNSDFDEVVCVWLGHEAIIMPAPS